jgi:hypothetical protein
MEAHREGFSVNDYGISGLLRLDKICSEYEANWSPNHSLANFQNFLLAHSSPASPEYIDLFCELAQIDIERRWRQLADSVNQYGLARPCAPSVSIREMPRYHHYLELMNFGNGDMVGDSLAKAKDLLAKCELRVRCQFGDVPHPAEYGLAAETINLDKFLPIVSIDDAGGNQCETRFFSPLEVGRQGVHEPDSERLYWNGNKLKLICSTLDDKSISRQQLTIRIIAGRQIQLENLSQNRWFLVGRETLVAPQSAVALQLPVIVDLDSLKIRFRRPMYE